VADDAWKSRIVHLARGQRDQAHNDRTQMVNIGDVSPRRTLVPGSRVAPRVDFAGLFRRHYELVKRTCEGFGQRGVAVFAIDGNDVAGTLCLSVKPDRPNAAIIGRHGMCDLFLEGDPSLSLRHLVLMATAAGRDEVRIHLVDLHTGTAFTDEMGRPLEAIEAEGPALVRCGRYALFFLPTGDGLPWPDDAESGWRCIPERVYLKESTAEPDRWARPRRADDAGLPGQRPAFEDVTSPRVRLPPAASPAADPDEDSGPLGAGPPSRPPRNAQPDLGAAAAAAQASPPPPDFRPAEPLPERAQAGTRTLIQARRGPARVGARLLADDEAVWGQLRIEAGGHTYRIPVGRDSVGRGVLVGRYERCDVGELTGLFDSRLSRVHLLLWAHGDSLFAVDTASTNGCFVDGNEVRLARLLPGRTLVLGEGLAGLRWLPAADR
jgi:hypothetical protein